MKKAMFSLIALSLLSIQIYAQSKQEKIISLLSIMQSERMIDKTFDNMLQVMKQQAAHELSKEQQDELMTFVMSEMKNMTKQAISNDYPAIYDKYFSEQEIDDLILFYKSPTGQKYLQAMPDVQKDLMTAMMTKYIPGFQQKVEEKKKELKKQ